MAVIHKAKDNSIKAILDEPELFVDFIRSFIPIDILKDIGPSDIYDFVEKIDERGLSEMLSIENYNVQETRREARAEAEKEKLKAIQLLKSAIKMLLEQGNTVAEVATRMNVSEQDIAALLPELA